MQKEDMIAYFTAFCRIERDEAPPQFPAEEDLLSRHQQFSGEIYTRQRERHWRKGGEGEKRGKMEGGGGNMESDLQEYTSFTYNRIHANRGEKNTVAQ